MVAVAAGGVDDRDLAANQVGGQRGQPIVLIVRKALLERHRPSLDIAGRAEALADRRRQLRKSFGRSAVEEPDHRHRGLLRARRQRHRRRAADECDERAAPYAADVGRNPLRCHRPRKRTIQYAAAPRRSAERSGYWMPRIRGA
jgi:hypothetical protein